MEIEGWKKWLTWLFRLLIGVVFIFSGFVKAVDPWGTIYKFQEYTSALGLNIWSSLLLVGVFGLCAFEFIIGISYIFGCYRKSNPILSMAFMGVMLPLTLWIAIKNPVADCGCFGDAFIISNWMTFWKNVIITILIVWLIRYNKTIPCIIAPALQWIMVVISGLFILVIGLEGYVRQPLLDFRGFKVGNNLYEEHSTNDDGEEYDSGENFQFIYAKDGITKTFDIDDELPSEDDGWVFVKRIPLEKQSENIIDGRSHSNTLHIWDHNGEEEVTDSLLAACAKTLIILIPDLRECSSKTTWKINALYDKAIANGVDIYAVVNGSEEGINDWCDLSLARYDIYTSDDTTIKEIARGNPAVIFVDHNIIKWKSTLTALDDDYILNKSHKFDPIHFAFDSSQTLRNYIWLYLALLGMLVMFSLAPKLETYRGLLIHKRTTNK